MEALLWRAGSDADLEALHTKFWHAYETRNNKGALRMACPICIRKGSHFNSGGQGLRQHYQSEHDQELPWP